MSEPRVAPTENVKPACGPTKNAGIPTPKTARTCQVTTIPLTPMDAPLSDSRRLWRGATAGAAAALVPAFVLPDNAPDREYDPRPTSVEFFAVNAVCTWNFWRRAKFRGIPAAGMIGMTRSTGISMRCWTLSARPPLLPA